MKIERSVIDRLKTEIVRVVEPVTRNAFLVLQLDELTLTLNRETKDFNGLVFEAMSETFIVSNGLELFVQKTVGADENYLKVEDERLIEVVNLFLEWRLAAIELLLASQMSD